MDFTFQDEDIETLKKYPKKRILAHQMGMGKTIISLKYINNLLTQNKQSYILIITPKFLQLYWQERIKDFIGCSSFKNVSDLKGPGVYLINYEKLINKERLQVYNRSWDLIVIDEANYIKNRNTKRFKAIDRIKRSHNIKDILLLTGTPIQNSVSEVWTLLYLCGFDMSYWQFIEHFAQRIRSPFGYKIIGIKNKDKLKEILDDYMIRRLRSEIGFTAKKIVEKVQYKMLPLQQDLYNRVRDVLKDEILPVLETTEGQKLRLDSIFARLIRLRQIADWAGLVEPSLPMDIGSNKYLALKSFLYKVEPSGALIFTQFKPFAQNLSKELKLELITGDVPVEEREEILKRLNKREIGVVATTQSLTYGVDVPRVRFEIFLDQMFNPKKQEQAEDRGYRIVRKEDLNIFIFQSYRSIDLHIDNLQNKKIETIKKILEAG